MAGCLPASHMAKVDRSAQTQPRRHDAPYWSVRALLGRNRRGMKYHISHPLQSLRGIYWSQQALLFKAVPLKACRYSTNATSNPPPEPVNGSRLKFPAWRSFAFTTICGAGVLYYFYGEKRRLDSNRKLEAPGAVGTPRLGGPLQLTDYNGAPFDSSKLENKFTLVYFGFTHCPDICPEELDKMTGIINIVERESTTSKILPVFVTVDPDRDGPAEIKEYLKDFHPSFIGLTGSKEEVKAVARKYRVYFRPARTSGGDSNDGDYLVDHSIFFFLIDPAGHYVTHFGRDASTERCAKIIIDALHSWDIAN